MITLWGEARSPRQNGTDDNFTRNLGVELFNGDVLKVLRVAKVLLRQRGEHDMRIRPHGTIVYLPSAEAA